MATWTVQSAVVNGEGSQIILSIEVQGSEITSDPNPDTSNADEGGIQQIVAYRFNPSTLAVTDSTSVGVRELALYGFVRTGSTLTFNLGIELDPTAAIATNANTQSPAFHWKTPGTGIPPEPPPLVTLQFSGLTLSGPPAAGSIAIDATKVGRLPTTTGEPLLLNVDAQAKYVQEDGTSGTGAQDHWEDISPQQDVLDGDSTPPGHKPVLEQTVNVPAMTFDRAYMQRFVLEDSQAPDIRKTATYAFVIIPEGEETDHHIVGQYNRDDTRCWRFLWDATEGRVEYQTRIGTTLSQVNLSVGTVVGPILVVARRREPSTVGR